MNRRSLILGLTGALAAPAIVRAESLMKITRLGELWVPFHWSAYMECRVLFVHWIQPESVSVWQPW